MKRIKFFLVAAMLLISASGVQAQSIGDLLTGLGKTSWATRQQQPQASRAHGHTPVRHVSSRATTAVESRRLSGVHKIENKITPVLKKYGVQASSTPSTAMATTPRRSRSAPSSTYTFDSKKKTITFKPHYGKEYTANVSILNNQMTLVFNADKLMHVLQTISNTAAKQNSTAATINTLMKSYNGMRLGFRLKK